jgi:8-hydroxy-5-deazaflavin:NADPH oxidoreductase
MSEQAFPPTRVGILGSGVVGRALAQGFAERGHHVVIGSRDPAKAGDLGEWLQDHDTIRAGTFEEAAAHGELLVLGVLGVAVEEAIEQAGKGNFAGKVVIDATNPLDFSQGFPPSLKWGHTDSGGEHAQRAVPDAKVVKAFNIIGNAYFVEPSFAGGAKPTMLIAGDDAEAKATVDRVAQSFGWPPAIDVGGIEAARELEALCILWVKISAPRGGWDHGFALLTG